MAAGDNLSSAKLNELEDLKMSEQQIVNQPFLYMNGLVISNDATTPNTLIDISAGQCRDSTNVYDINLGNFLGVNPNLSANTSTTLNAAVNGVNGLDTGSFAASTLYYVYVIADPQGFNATATIMSKTSTGPLMPTGYGAYRLIGYAVSDGSTHFLKAYISGNNNSRIFTYDAPQATSVTAGAATSYTAVDLTKFVPLPATGQNIPVNISYAYTPNAASDTFKMQPVNATGDAVTITGQVTTVVVSGIAQVQAQLASAKPEINYKVSSGSDAVAINVAGFLFYV